MISCSCSILTARLSSMSGVSPVSYNYPPLPQAELEQLLALPGHADRRRSRSGAARSRAIGAALGARGPRRVGACRTELTLPARRCAQAIVRCHIWMWNGDQAQYHWDVQITDYFMGRIGAQDNHINVCPQKNNIGMRIMLNRAPSLTA